MGIKLVTFAAQTVTPQDDALIYETALQESGMIYGGSVSIKNANVLHVEAGHGALCGRKFTIEATDVPVPLTPSGSLQGRIYIHMDLSDTGEPISFQVETASTLTPVVQQSDVNINSGIYEINLATFIVDTSTISNLVNVAPFIDISPDSEFSASSKNPLMNKAITKAIGDPETIGGSASQPYTKGALLLATDGQIYEVTQNIALHGSIVNGGNVRPTGNIISQISNLANLIPKNYGIEDIPLQRGGAMDANLAFKRVRIFNANSGALPAFATSGNNDMIVINHWYADGNDSVAIQIAYNVRADNIAFRRYLGGWQAWHTII